MGIRDRPWGDRSEKGEGEKAEREGGQERQEPKKKQRREREREREERGGQPKKKERAQAHVVSSERPREREKSAGELQAVGRRGQASGQQQACECHPDHTEAAALPVCGLGMRACKKMSQSCETKRTARPAHKQARAANGELAHAMPMKDKVEQRGKKSAAQAATTRDWHQH